MENNKPVTITNNTPVKKEGILTIAKNAVGKGVKKLTSKALAPYKNFFFTELVAGSQFLDVEKNIGEIHTVKIFISKDRTFMRSESAITKADTEFTPEEKVTMLKTWRVKQSTVDACKSILISFHIKEQKISIVQNKLDGTIKDINI